MIENNIKNNLESLIFAASQDISYKKLSQLLKIPIEEIKQVVKDLNQYYEQNQSGLRLVFNDISVQMATVKNNSNLVEELIRSEVKEELTPAALETLTIISYKGSLRKIDIDFIRGVNSTHTLRSLLIRGLIERASDKHDARSFVYQPSLEFLKTLGVSNITELPDYQETNKKLEEIKQQFSESQQNQENGK